MYSSAWGVPRNRMHLSGCFIRPSVSIYFPCVDMALPCPWPCSLTGAAALPTREAGSLTTQNPLPLLPHCASSDATSSVFIDWQVLCFIIHPSCLCRTEDSAWHLCHLLLPSPVTSACAVPATRSRITSLLSKHHLHARFLPSFR